MEPFLSTSAIKPSVQVAIISQMDKCNYPLSDLSTPSCSPLSLSFQLSDFLDYGLGTHDPGGLGTSPPLNS